jgi:hypothetical protein
MRRAPLAANAGYSHAAAVDLKPLRTLLTVRIKFSGTGSIAFGQRSTWLLSVPLGSIDEESRGRTQTRGSKFLVRDNQDAHAVTIMLSWS